jgi:hypothetical protein
MEQLRDLADDRLISGCIYCGGLPETRDHVPSRVLLDRPLPTNLPVLPACSRCNGGFSADEEYFACLLETAMVGSTEPDAVRRPVVSEVLRRNPALRARLEAARQSSNGHVAFSVDPARAEAVLLKLARGHAAYELSTLCREAPTQLSWGPISSLPAHERDLLDEAYVADFFPEIGSRGMQRMLVTQITVQGPNGQTEVKNVVVVDWVDVQDGRYRYLAYEDPSGIRVRIVLGEYLYADVFWSKGAQ